MAISRMGISETLAVYRITGDDPHVLVERDAGGLVRIEPTEVGRLADVLTLLAGDLERPADGPGPDFPEWADDGEVWSAE